MPACDDWIAYHGLATPLDEGQTFSFGGLDTHPAGIHVGSLPQAIMRSRPGCPVVKVRIKGSSMSRSPKRVRDRPDGWSKIAGRHAREGCEALVYLNRSEGFPVEALDRLSSREIGQLDTMPEAKLRKLVPELEDSWVILDPNLVEVVEILNRDQVRLLRQQHGDEAHPSAPSPA